MSCKSASISTAVKTVLCLMYARMEVSKRCEWIGCRSVEYLFVGCVSCARDEEKAVIAAGGNQSSSERLWPRIVMAGARVSYTLVARVISSLARCCTRSARERMPSAVLSRVTCRACGSGREVLIHTCVQYIDEEIMRDMQHDSACECGEKNDANT